MALELQSISVFFNEGRITSYYQEKIWELPLLTETTSLRSQFVTLYGNFDVATIQLLDHYSEPRIIFIDNGEVVNKVTLVTVSTEHPTLYAELQATRLLIEAEITNQLNPE